VDLAGLDQLGHRPPGVLHRHRAVHPVLVVQVDMVDPEPRQRPITGPPDVVRFPVDAHPAAIGPVLVAELGGQHHLVAVSGDRPPDQPLVGERSVHVGGVQQGDAQLQRPVDGGDRLLLVGRPIRLAHHQAAQADGRDPQTLTAERALLHPAFLGDRPSVRLERRGEGSRSLPRPFAAYQRGRWSAQGRPHPPVQVATAATAPSRVCSRGRAAACP
jgi:hypothetical protein